MAAHTNRLHETGVRDQSWSNITVHIYTKPLVMLGIMLSVTVCKAALSNDVCVSTDLALER